MGTRVGFYLCHAEGPFFDIGSEAVTRVLERYCETDYLWTDDPTVERIAARFAAGGISAVLQEPEDDLRTHDAAVAASWSIDPCLLTLARRVLREGRRALRIGSADEASAVDRLAERLGDDTYPHGLDNPFLYVSHWDGVRDIVRGLSPRAGDLWDHLSNGRGVGRPDGTFPYRREDGVHRSSFWTLEECRFLGPLLVDAHARARRDASEHACAFESTRAAVVIAVREGLGVRIHVG